MKTIKQLIATKLCEGIAALGAPTAPDVADLVAMLEYPPDEAMGDLALPCFKLSRTLRRAPVQIAATLSEALNGLEVIERAEAVNGYLNITVSKSYLVNNVLSGILAAGERYGAGNEGQGKTVVLDYSSPNVAKPFHIGHLGTTVIGHSLKKLHEFAG
ncbi:MAG: arginine--tRNA ligase, partial [Clostridia bacterium]|nr:arginine--tRNA ligase [Clostridia bacterium]